MNKYLHSEITRLLREKLGFERLTLVQEKTIEYFAKTLNERRRRNFRHLLISSPTGSGKTLAALLPILSDILNKYVSDDPIKILYITPLRALNRDLFERIRSLLQFLGYDIAIWHGDTPSSERLRIKSRPPLILITTPESLQYIVVSRELREALRNVEYVIVDEIHEIVDDERGCELSVGLERLWSLTGPHMRIGLSGTIGDLDQVARFLSNNRAYDIIDVSYEKSYEVKIVISSSDENNKDSRAEALAELLERVKKPVLIFANTRDEVEYLGNQLRNMGYEVYVHHGSLSKTERIEVEKRLREGSIDGVIATSSLELGIDIGYLENVIQISSPRQVTKLVQRIGRSGHRERNISRGYIVSSSNIYDLIECAAIARRTSEITRNNRVLEKPRIRSNPLDVLVHQIIGIALERNEVSVEDVYRVVKRSICFKDLSIDLFNEALKYASEARLISLENNKIKPTAKGSIYYYKTTMIVDTKKYDVVDIVSRKKLGSLDEDFVLKSLSRDSYIVLSGRVWRIEDIREDVIYVSEFIGEEFMIPKWFGQQIPVERNVAREACALLDLVSKDPEKASEIWGREIVETLSKKLRRSGGEKISVPSEKRVVIESYSGNGYAGSSPSLMSIHVCLGSRGNRSLGYYLQEVLASEYGLETSVATTPYSVIILSKRFISPELVVEILSKERSREEIIDILKKSLERSDDIRWYLVAVAKKIGAIDRDVSLEEAKRFARFYKGTLIWREAIEEALYELLDAEVLIDFLNKLWGREIGYEILYLDKPSLLTSEALDLLSGLNRRMREAREIIDSDVMIDLVKKRLDHKEVELICIVCGHVFTKRIKELDEVIRCERCGSVLIGLNKYRDSSASSLIKRVLRNPSALSKLSDEEKKIINFIRSSADLIAANGKKAVYVLSATGVGLDVAKKILWSSRDQNELFRNIIYAEIKYARTRDYWDR